MTFSIVGVAALSGQCWHAIASFRAACRLCPLCFRAAPARWAQNYLCRCSPADPFTCLTRPALEALDQALSSNVAARYRQVNAIYPLSRLFHREARRPARGRMNECGGFMSCWAALKHTRGDGGCPSREAARMKACRRVRRRRAMRAVLAARRRSRAFWRRYGLSASPTLAVVDLARLARAQTPTASSERWLACMLPG